MNPVFAQGNRRTVQRLSQRRRQAMSEKVPRVAQRLHGIVLSLEGHSTSEIARLLPVHRSTVPFGSTTGISTARKDCGKGSARDVPPDSIRSNGKHSVTFWTAAPWPTVWTPAFGPLR